MGLNDSIFDACADIVEKKHNQELVKRFLIYELVYYAVNYLDDDLYSKERKKWIKELKNKYGDFLNKEWNGWNEWNEYHNTLVDIASEVDEKMWGKYYDVIWKDFDDLPLNDLDKLLDIIENRTYPLLDEIYDCLKQNYDYFKKGFIYLKNEK